jgi:hypothetical protein
MGTKEQREHQRFKIADQSMHAKIASAKMVEILDISIGGMLLQTDMRLNISKEYTIQIEHNGKRYSLKGSVVWSVLKGCKSDQLGNSIPIYRSGIQFLYVPEEMAHSILFIGNSQKQQEHDAMIGEKYYSLSIDTLDVSNEEREYLEAHLSSIYGQ